MIYQLGGKTSEHVPLPGGLVEAVKIKTLNARLPENLPPRDWQRVRYDLMFNAQGKGPYLLAWGTGLRNRRAWRRIC